MAHRTPSLLPVIQEPSALPGADLAGADALDAARRAELAEAVAHADQSARRLRNGLVVAVAGLAVASGGFAYHTHTATSARLAALHAARPEPRCAATESAKSSPPQAARSASVDTPSAPPSGAVATGPKAPPLGSDPRGKGSLARMPGRGAAAAVTHLCKSLGPNDPLCSPN
jgi:hypothetical protein